MKDLKKLFNECMEEVKAIGIKPGEIIKLEINYRFKKTWGRCSYVDRKKKTYMIEISDKLLQDEIDDNATKTTIIHEILHSCEKCMNHGPEWKKLAELVNKNYPQYNIKRTTSSSEKGIELNPDNFKYVLECNGCKKLIGYHRMCKIIKYSDYFKCAKCGGKFVLIKK